MSPMLRTLLDVRAINDFYLTSYTAEQLDAWRDVDIAEAITYAQVMTNANKHD